MSREDPVAGDGPGGDAAHADRDDPMGPPKDPCECWCMHCRRTFMSTEMWFQRVIGDRRGFKGFWMCPTPNCGGAGFTFDIFPTDPDHPANDGWYDDSDDEGDGEEDAQLSGDDDLEAEEFDKADLDGAASEPLASRASSDRD